MDSATCSLAENRARKAVSNPCLPDLLKIIRIFKVISIKRLQDLFHLKTGDAVLKLSEEAGDSLIQQREKFDIVLGIF